MKRAFYSDAIANFIALDKDLILGKLAAANNFALEQTQRNAWIEEINILKKVLSPYSGAIYFEYSIPRMGRRIDVVLLIQAVIFVLEFKIGEKEFTSYALDQVFDYALDLKNFHDASHAPLIAPILIASQAVDAPFVIALTPQNDQLLLPITVNFSSLNAVISEALKFADGPQLEREVWERGRYCPTPTIMEAAMALYNGHSVEDISRNDAKDINLKQTSQAIADIISISKLQSRKSICFVTGVPGSGKTLVGLNIATTHNDKNDALHSVFLSGNSPLVAVLSEALVRDKVRRIKEQGGKAKKGELRSVIKKFIQNIHHFRDDCLEDLMPPIEHVTLFDEAQRAWDKEQTSSFMSRKKGRPGFNQSEPEFLISCLDRHKDWAVVVCLVGGGQEINTGEAGIGEWICALEKSFLHWDVYISPHLNDSEYGIDLSKNTKLQKVVFKDELHLSVSMRSFRAERLSQLVKELLDLDLAAARNTLQHLKNKYPIVLTRDLDKAKKWLKNQARGSERYGMVVSSQAERLRPHAIHVKSPMDPINWFLGEKADVRSSYYLEDVATEFHVQGLELDWACVVWDADFRYANDVWKHWSFRGSRWNHIHKEKRKKYLKNAYRVLLTRARQGMVIVVPAGDLGDPTRDPKFYNPTFNYLKEIGFKII